MFRNRKEMVDYWYNKIEAMYRQNLSITEMRQITKLTEMELICATQRIFALDQMKRNRKK